MVFPMRVVKKIVMKFVTLLLMVALLGAVMRYARPLLMKSAGLPTEMPTTPGKEGVHFSSEESDLMATVFKSAIRLLTGSASRQELAGELSTKLYAGRADPATMSELGIELVQPGGVPPVPGASSRPGMNPAARAGVARTLNPPSSANPPLPPATPPGGVAANNRRDALLARLQSKALANPELALAPVVFTGMLVVRGIKRRRRSPLDDLVLPDMSKLLPSDSAPYEMTHAVHALKAEDFELLVALVYQRQGYRVSMPAGLSGGRGGDFMLQRKSERLLVQCKKHAPGPPDARRTSARTARGGDDGGGHARPVRHVVRFHLGRAQLCEGQGADRHQRAHARRPDHRGAGVGGTKTCSPSRSGRRSSWPR